MSPRTLRLLMQPAFSGMVMLLTVVVGFSMYAPAFGSLANMRNILLIMPELGLVTLGITVLIISGEFDLSVGSTFALAPMLVVLAFDSGLPLLPAVTVGLLAAAIVGYVNGWITLRFDMPSFIVTLGMLFAVRSLTVIASGGFPPPFPEQLSTGLLVADFVWFKASLLWFVGVAVVLGVFLHKTNWGNWVFAAGGQVQAARDMGVPVRQVKLGCFVLCSLLAGFAGIIQTFRLQTPLPGAGEGMELQALAAAVIGGTALAGGIGSIIGAVIGTGMIRIMENGLVMSRIDANWFKLALGALTVGSVVLNMWVRGRVLKARRHG